MKRRGKATEILDEFRTIVLGRRHWLDSIAPPLLFLLVHIIGGLWWAIGFASFLSILIIAIRWKRGQPLRFAVAGFGGTLIASLIALLAGRSQAYYYPGLVSGAFTTLACLGSILFKRPLLAWTSHFARQWPMPWYWHPRVRPAYSEATALWFAFFLGRFLIQIFLLATDRLAMLSALRFLLGWPAIALLLIVSYLYGGWRLKHLRGPSVDEFVQGAPPPWEGQRRGF